MPRTGSHVCRWSWYAHVQRRRPLINAGSATIINQGFGAVTFSGTSTAGSANVINQAGSAVTFSGTSTAGSASINNQGNLIFVNNASAGNATISNDFFVGFELESTAANATVHTARGGVQFLQNASGGLARFITDASGSFNIATATAPVTVGSIEGAGVYFLGANQLTTGGNDRSTTVTSRLRHAIRVRVTRLEQLVGDLPQRPHPTLRTPTPETLHLVRRPNL